MAVNKITAPWSPGQVEALNHYQKHGHFHPFTCGNHRQSEPHVRYAAESGDRDLGLLVATTDGWVCPACEYTQKWAHGFMAELAPPDQRKTEGVSHG